MADFDVSNLCRRNINERIRNRDMVIMSEINAIRMNELSYHEKEFIYKFRALTEREKGTILSNIETLILRKYEP